MKLLVVNDDGIKARGVNELIAALVKVHEVYVCCPDSQRSANSHAITIADPLFAERVEIEGVKEAYAVSGTPADCTKFGVDIMGRPDVVVSGINHGPNTGVDIMYSGTVSAAAEGVAMGIQSIAVSVMFAREYSFSAACHYALKMLDLIEGDPFPPKTVLNLNCPSCEAGEVKGVRFVPMGWNGYAISYERRISPRGMEYYWPPDIQEIDGDKGTDTHWLKRGYATVTPLCYDLTHKELLSKLQSRYE